MNKRYEALCLLLIVFLFLILMYQQAELIGLKKLPSASPLLLSDPESLIALNKRIPLQNADIYALELIPGISDTLAFRIIQQREEIIKAAGTYSEKPYLAFTCVKGIGPKSAKVMDRYISF